MMKKIVIATLFVLALLPLHVQAQGFWKSFGNALLNGVNQAAQNVQQQRAPRQQQQRRGGPKVIGADAGQMDDGFTAANTGIVGSSSFGKHYDYPDGSWFQGSMANGKPAHGKIHYSDGLEATGHFNANSLLEGIGLLEWPDGSWYYGYFSNGNRHGEGSYYQDGKYYDVVSSQNEITSATEVATPRYNKATLTNMQQAATMAALDAQAAEMNGGSSSGSRSGTATGSSASQSRTHRKTCHMCNGSGVCKTCNGKRVYIPYIGANAIPCSSCAQKGKCMTCQGTGRVFSATH